MKLKDVLRNYKLFDMATTKYRNWEVVICEFGKGERIRVGPELNNMLKSCDLFVWLQVLRDVSCILTKVV